MIDTPKSAPRIAVAGHLVYDEIVFPDGAITSALGGITYNLAAFCAVMTDGRLLPVCEIGSDRRETFDKAFGRCGVLDDSLINTIDLPNVVNRLVYNERGKRMEWNSRVPESLSLAPIPKTVDCALLNFISGDDFELNDLRGFRDSFDGIIYMDYHSLALGRSPDGGRYYRKHPRWREYTSAADILQLNLAELSTIMETKGADPKSVMESCKAIHDSGPDTIIVTMGENGVVLSVASDSTAWLIPPISIEKEVDATGCGDTLAAVTLYYHIRGEDILQSLRKGSLWAAAKATFSGLDGFADIENILARIEPSIEPLKL